MTVEAGPGEGDHQPVALRLRQPRRFVDVADHRAVAGAADLQRDRLAVAHGDAFQARLEGPVAVRGQVAPRVLGIDALQVGVLDVRAGIGVAPGDALVMADDEQRGAGEVGAGEAQAGDLQAGQVEGRRVGQAQVRIVGQQRLAGGAAAGGDHPVVRTDALDVGTGQLPQQLAGVRRAVQGAVQAGVVAGGRRPLARIGGEHLVDPRQVQVLGQRQALQLHAQVGAQGPGIEQVQGQAVHRPPGPRPLVAHQAEFQRQRRRGQLQVGVDPVAVALQQDARGRVQVGVDALGGAPEAQGAGEPVHRQGLGAEHFGERPAGIAAGELHLPQAIPGVAVAEQEIAVLQALRADMRDAGGVPGDPPLVFQAMADLDLAVLEAQRGGQQVDRAGQ